MYEGLQTSCNESLPARVCVHWLCSENVRCACRNRHTCRAFLYFQPTMLTATNLTRSSYVMSSKLSSGNGKALAAAKGLAVSGHTDSFSSIDAAPDAALAALGISSMLPPTIAPAAVSDSCPKQRTEGGTLPVSAYRGCCGLIAAGSGLGGLGAVAVVTAPKLPARDRQRVPACPASCSIEVLLQLMLQLRLRTAGTTPSRRKLGSFSCSCGVVCTAEDPGQVGVQLCADPLRSVVLCVVSHLCRELPGCCKICLLWRMWQTPSSARGSRKKAVMKEANTAVDAGLTSCRTKDKSTQTFGLLVACCVELHAT